MRFILWALILVAGVGVGLAASKFDERPIRPFWGVGFLDKLSETNYPRLTATGSWMGHESISRTNQVSIDCDLERKMCTVTLAQVKADHGLTFLSLDHSYFEVTQVDQHSLTALSSSRDSCFRDTLSIDRTAKSAVLTRVSEAGADCAAWKGDPKTWALLDGRKLLKN